MGRWADILKDVTGGFQAQEGVVPAFPHLRTRRRGLREERSFAHGARLRGEGLGLEPLCPLAGSWLSLVCKLAGRAKEASWCCGDLWKMKRRQRKEGRGELSQKEGAQPLEASGPQALARVC